MERVAADDNAEQQPTMEQVMLDLLREMDTAVTTLEAAMEAVMITGGVVQPLADAAANLYGNHLSGLRTEALGDGKRVISEIMDTMSKVKQSGQQPMVDATTNCEVVEQPMEDAIAVMENNSWDTQRKNTQKTRRRKLESARGSAGIYRTSIFRFSHLVILGQLLYISL